MTVSARDENSGEEITIQLPIVAARPARRPSTSLACRRRRGCTRSIPASSPRELPSAITFIDGPAGVLLHRGYGIDASSWKSATSRSSALLNNRLPASQRRLDLFTEEVIRRMSVDRSFPDDAHRWS